jgi:hypothetical protein
MKRIVTLAFALFVITALWAQTELRNGSQVTGTLARNRVPVSYTFTVPEWLGDGHITVETTGSTDTFLEVYLGNEKLIEDDNSGQNNNARIANLRILAGRTYRIDVRGASDRVRGQFSIRLEFDQSQVQRERREQEREQQERQAQIRREQQEQQERERQALAEFDVNRSGQLSRYGGTEIDVVIPSSVAGRTITVISDGAFRNNQSITSVIIPEGVTRIGDNAFSGCTALVSVTLPSTLTDIGSGAFSGCTALASISLPPSLRTIGYRALSGTAITELSISPEITSFDISGMNGLTLTLSEGITGIRDRQFENVSGLIAVNLPSTIREIGRSAFYRTGISSIVIPEGVTRINDDTFYGCNALTSITLPSTLKEIGGGAFNGTRITEITIPSGVTRFGQNTFPGSLRTVTYAEGTTRIMTSIGVSGLRSVTTINLPSTLTEIGDLVFRETGITSIVIPEGVTSIGGHTFSQCYYLTSVTLPSTISSIGNGAFFDCISLSTVIIPSSVTRIQFGEQVFIKNPDTGFNVVPFDQATSTALQRVGYRGNF